MRIDQFTNAQELLGKNFMDVPFELRISIHKELSTEEMQSVYNGTATPSTLEKIQVLIGGYNEMFRTPTLQEKFDQSREKQRLSDIENIRRQMGYAEKKLDHLNKLFELDANLPIGERAKLKQQIENYKADLNRLEGSSTPSKTTLSPETMAQAKAEGITEIDNIIAGFEEVTNPNHKTLEEDNE